MVKVERPGRGDETRAWAPPLWGPEGALFLSFNRNKRSLALDVKAPAARPVLERLVRRSDVLVQSFRPGSAEALGFGAAAGARAQPRLVYCSVTAFGTRGPLREQPGLRPDDAGLQRFHAPHGAPGPGARRAPAPRWSTWAPGCGRRSPSWPRSASGTVPAKGARSPRRSSTPRSRGSPTSSWATWRPARCPQPQGSGAAMIVPYQAFPTADGWLMITTPTDALFGRLCEALGRAGAGGRPAVPHQPRPRPAPRDAGPGAGGADAAAAPRRRSSSACAPPASPRRRSRRSTRWRPTRRPRRARCSCPRRARHPRPHDGRAPRAVRRRAPGVPGGPRRAWASTRSTSSASWGSAPSRWASSAAQGVVDWPLPE